jgi:hypothetical protein
LFVTVLENGVIPSTEAPDRSSSAELPWIARHESALARAGLGAIALHLLDDAFLQPEPGTSAGDHLVSGIVPVALLLALAAVYPRLRAGLRGCLAVAVGLLAAAAGVAVPVRHALLDGPSGDDFTGFAGLLGGVVLAVVGSAVLWRSRRMGESRVRRYVRRSLVALAALVAAFELVVPVGIAFFATHKPREPVAEVDLGRAHEPVSLTTADGLGLAGWYVPSQNGAAVIVFPGRAQPVDHARMLVRHGYGVLLLDRRGEGESDGDYNAFGWGGDADLLAAIHFLRARPDVDPERIGGLGLSVGGELLLETAAGTEALRAVVSEGAGYRSIREQLLIEGPGKWLMLPNYAVTTGATAIFANQGPPPNLRDLVARIAPRPVLLVYAEQGGNAGEEHLSPLYAEAAGDSATVWAVPDAGHTDALAAHPGEYEDRVVTFLDGALLGGR